MKKIFIVLISLGTFGYLFYSIILPKFLVYYMQSEGAPQILKEVNQEIKNNSKNIIKAINKSGLKSSEAVKIIEELNSTDIRSIIEKLNASGFKSSQDCAKIIASQFKDSGVNTTKLERIISKNLSLRDIQNGVQQLSSMNQAAINTALPMIKEILNEELRKND